MNPPKMNINVVGKPKRFAGKGTRARLNTYATKMLSGK